MQINSPNKNAVISHAEISRVAYMNWEKDGRPQGRDAEYWLQAESHLKASWHLLHQEHVQNTPSQSAAATAKAIPALKKNGRAKAVGKTTKSVRL